ncbi:MAG TPA: FtsX-like permease family protein, partial [Bdellovibrio sp.]|nr:FtsX-like permease family protein [Bdellovibrio sp.]
LLSVIAAFYSIVIFKGYVSDVSEVYRDVHRHRFMYGDFILENKNIRTPEGRAEPFQYLLTTNEQASVSQFVQRHADLIQTSARFLNIQGMISNGMNSMIFLGLAGDVSEAQEIRGDQWAWNVLSGKPLSAKQDMDLILASGMAKTLGCQSISGQVSCETREMQLSVGTEKGQLNAMDFNVTGIMDPGYRDLDSSYLMISLSAAQKLFSTQKISYISFLLKPQTNFSHFKDLFTQEILTQYPNLHLQTSEEHPNGELYIKTVSFLSGITNLVVAVIIFITLLSVINIKVKAIKERTKEIGVLRSLGLPRSAIRRIFLWESLTISVFGISFGFIAAMTTRLLILNAEVHYTSGLFSMPILLGIRVDSLVCLNISALLVLMGLAVTYISSIKILRQRIIENLGHI